jgi:hypothetical protein
VLVRAADTGPDAVPDALPNPGRGDPNDERIAIANHVWTFCLSERVALC